MIAKRWAVAMAVVPSAVAGPPPGVDEPLLAPRVCTVLCCVCPGPPVRVELAKAVLEEV